MVLLEVLSVGGLGILSGVGIGYLLSSKTKILQKLSKRERERVKMGKDPELLKRKLEEGLEGSGKYIIDGKEQLFKIVETDGKKEFVLEEKAMIIVEKIVEKKPRIKKKPTIKK